MTRFLCCPHCLQLPWLQFPSVCAPSAAGRERVSPRVSSALLKTRVNAPWKSDFRSGLVVGGSIRVGPGDDGQTASPRLRARLREHRLHGRAVCGLGLRRGGRVVRHSAPGTGETRRSSSLNLPPLPQVCSRMWSAVTTAVRIGTKCCRPTMPSPWTVTSPPSSCS